MKKAKIALRAAQEGKSKQPPYRPELNLQVAVVRNLY